MSSYPSAEVRDRILRDITKTSHRDLDDELKRKHVEINDEFRREQTKLQDVVHKAFHIIFGMLCSNCSISLCYNPMVNNN